MLHIISTWLFVAAFFGAGLVNVIGVRTTLASFVRWGYPAWWCRVTGGLEMACAILLALPATRVAGLILGALIVAAAMVTVLRHSDFGHLAPLGVVAALLALSEMSS